MNVSGILSAVVSQVEATGLFETVNSHEPKSTPSSGPTAAVWCQRIRPYAAGSGLSASSGVVVFTVRLYASMMQQPYDDIDPAIMTATDTLMAAYSGDFTLGGLIRDVDLLGMTGAALESVAGYVTIDGVTLRVMDITLPLIVNDLWTQVP